MTGEVADWHVESRSPSCSGRERWLATRPRRRVLELRFGLGAEAPHTPGQAARVLGITPRRVRCAEDRALRHLRASPATGALRDAA